MLNAPRATLLAMSLSGCGAPSLIETTCTPEQESFLERMQDILVEIPSPFPAVNKDLQARGIGEDEGIGCAKPNPKRTMDAAGTYTGYKNQVLINMVDRPVNDCDDFEGESVATIAFNNGYNGHTPHHLKGDTHWHGDCLNLIIETGGTLVHESAHAAWGSHHPAELDALHEKQYSSQLTDDEKKRVETLESNDPTYQAGDRWQKLVDLHWEAHDAVGRSIGTLQMAQFDECKETCEKELKAVIEKFDEDSEAAMRAQLAECGEMEDEQEEECRDKVDRLNDIAVDLMNYGNHNLDDVCRDQCAE